jgi:orotidine-5'-phosphate decarboxylase
MSQFFGEVQSGIIFAADLLSYQENAEVLRKIADHIDVIKINQPLVYSEGMDVIARLAGEFNKPVFADLKVGDVPHTNAAIVQAALKNGASAVMVHAFVGPDGLRAAVDAAEDRLGIIAQIELTSPGGEVFNAPIADEMAEIAASESIYGVQAPGNRPERIARIRSIVGPDCVIVCCGVGAQGGSYGSVMAAGGS